MNIPEKVASLWQNLEQFQNCKANEMKTAKARSRGRTRSEPLDQKADPRHRLEVVESSDAEAQSGQLRLVSQDRFARPIPRQKL